jgi:hypothetical protein
MTEPIKHSSRALLFASAALVSACGLTVERGEQGATHGTSHDVGSARAMPEPAAALDPGATNPGATKGALDPVVLPSSIPVVLASSMTCVSSPFDDGTRFPQVLRAQIAGSADTATVTLSKGPQFASHAGSSSAAAADQDVRDVVRSADGAVLEQQGGLRIQLYRDGPVMRGSLSDADDGARELGLTCWNESELSGSPWTGEPGLLPAHFDWGTGGCVDRAGAPALNPTPIEVVRETRAGECSDLSGVALNGDDRMAADLDGWRLLGARLDGARLVVANLRFASLQGADLSGLELGYATVQGTIDGNTALPELDDACEITRSPWAGDSVSCTR